MSDTQSSPGAGVAGRVLRAAFVVLLCKIVWKLGGILGKVALSQFGAGAATDAYFLVADAVILALFFAGESILKPALIPVFTEALQKEGEKTAWRFGSTLLAFVLAAGAVVVLLGMAAAPWIVDVFAPKLSVREVAVPLLRLMFPALAALWAGTVTYAILNAYKRFAVPESGETAYKFLFAGTVFTGFALMGGDYRVLGVAVLLGAAGRLCCHLAGLRDKLRYLRPALAWNTPVMRRFAWLALPLLLGAFVPLLRNCVEAAFAVSREGDLSSLRFARSVVDAFVSVAPMAAAVGMFPFLSEWIGSGKRREAGDALNRALRILAFVCLPVAGLVIGLAPSIVEVLFGRKSWTAWQILDTAQVLQIYSAGLLFFAAEVVLMHGFFSLRRNWFPVIVGACASIFHVLFQWSGIELFPAHRLLVLAVALPVSRGLKNVILAWVLGYRLPVFARRGTFLLFAGMVVLGGVGGTVGWYADTLLRPVMAASLAGTPALVVNALRLAVAGGLASGAVLVTAVALRVEELRFLWDRVRRRNG